ncbi:MAG: hypothetical protein AAFO82_16725 [Bacteroidota bacterium]
MKVNLLSLLILTLLSSCATVKFYDDAELSKESGIEFYSAKPYLLVERKLAKDIALKSTIIYLPDMGKPKYAKLKPGFGSSDLKLSLSNGIITSYGVTSDSKIPETITALTGVLGATGTTYKSFAEAIDILKGDDEDVAEQAGDVASMQKAKTIIDAVISDFESMKDSDLLTSKQKSDFNSALSFLKTQNNEINKLSVKQIPKIVTELDKIIKAFKAFKIGSESDKAKDFKAKLATNISELSKARELLQPKKKASEPTFELYEIVITKDKTELKKVELPKK